MPPVAEKTEVQTEKQTPTPTQEQIVEKLQESVATPPGETPAEPQPVGNDEDFSPMEGIDELLEDDDDNPPELTAEDETPPATPAQPPEAPRPPEVPTPPVAEVPAPEQPAAVPPGETPPVQPVQPEPEAPTPPVQEAAPTGPSLEEQRTAALTELEKRYAFTEDDATAVLSEPEKVLPQFFGRLYMDVFENVLNSIQSALPQMVTQIQQQAELAGRDTQEFYGAWPKLKEHSETVNRLGQMYRQTFPQATKEQFIQDVGLQAMITLKLPLEGVQPPAQTPPPDEVVTVPPYTPPRGGPVTPPAQHPDNPWADMAEEYIQDDRGV